MVCAVAPVASMETDSIIATLRSVTTLFPIE
jgi:hypothetical protein